MKKVWEAISRYFKGVKKEIGRIRWTIGSDLLKYSIATLVVMVCFGLFFYGIDILVSLIRSLM